MDHEVKISRPVADQCVACLVIREDVCGRCHVCKGCMRTSEWPRGHECCDGSHECVVCRTERKCYMMIRIGKLKSASKMDKITKASDYRYVCSERCRSMFVEGFAGIIVDRIDLGSDKF